MAVVAAIIGFLSTALVTSFSRSRIDLDQSVNLIASTIRIAQTKAIASTVYNAYNPCGYGIHYIDTRRIAIYVGPNASTTSCSTMNKNYSSARDSIVLYQTLTDTRTEIKAAFSDIFFLPPDPKTYLNNDASLGQAPIGIQIGIIGTACPTNCKTVYVYPSGQIDTQ